jgi:hypothetical protein
MVEYFVQNIHYISYYGEENSDFMFHGSQALMPYDLIQRAYGITFGYPPGVSQAAIEVNFVSALLKAIREKETQQKTKGKTGLFVGFEL